MSHTVFAPHGMCMMWNQRLIWLHVITDALVALAYYSIPAALFLVVRKKSQALPFRPLLILFGLFIAFCGAGHLMDIISIWQPIYWFKGFWNAGTAVTSVLTAIVLIPKVAGFIQIPEATARLQREKEMIEERHGLITNVLDSVLEGILLTSESGHLLAHNSAALALLGPTLATNWPDHLPQDRQILERGDGLVIERSTKPIPGVGQLYVFRDITEERRANATLLELQHVIATMRKGFAIVTVDGLKIESANAAMAAQHGYTSEELTGMPVVQLHAGEPAERDKCLNQILSTTQDQGFWEGEIRSLRKDHSIFTASVRANRHHSGDREFLSFLQTDITEQKLLQAEAAAFQGRLLQAQKLESLGVLAGGVAHDFNNLLTGIMGNTSLAIEFLGASNPALPHLQVVLKASERASDLTRQLLAYSGKGRFLVKQLDVSALARETRALVNLSIPKSVTLNLNLPSDLPMVEADSAQIQQLLMNLVINAAEAIGDRPGTVQVSTGVQVLENPDLATNFASDNLVPGPYVFIEVQDNGSGMDEDTKAQIFDPFFTTKFTGRGLGLAAALGIVRGHGGTIKVYSVPKMGSTFKVYFPVTKEQQAQPAPADPISSAHSGTGTVLVVDDEEVVRNTTCNALKHFGYHVETAENGQLGVQRFLQTPQRYCAVLLDLTMPVMGGEEAFTQMLNIRPDIPIVLTSGFNESEAIRNFAGKRLAAFLQKPFTAQQLAKAIKTATRC